MVSTLLPKPIKKVIIRCLELEQKFKYCLINCLFFNWKWYLKLIKCFTRPGENATKKAHANPAKVNKSGFQIEKAKEKLAIQIQKRFRGRQVRGARKDVADAGKEGNYQMIRIGTIANESFK